MVSKHRKAIESTYDHQCIVYQRIPEKNSATKITSFKESIVVENEPCRLSYKTLSTTGTGQVSAVIQEVKLFISPEIDIRPGSKLTVTKNGMAEDYERSGKPAIYDTHQEVVLKAWEGWA